MAIFESGRGPPKLRKDEPRTAPLFHFADNLGAARDDRKWNAERFGPMVAVLKARLRGDRPDGGISKSNWSQFSPSGRRPCASVRQDEKSSSAFALTASLVRRSAMKSS